MKDPELSACPAPSTVSGVSPIASHSAALSEAAEESRGADQRTGFLLTVACDYRDSACQRNARIKTFLEDTFALDSWRPLTPSDVPYQGPLELLHDLPEQSRVRLARRGDETMLALIESMRQPIAQNGYPFH